ncbi:MAG: flavodoxin-dependent (E)-4-hydroxy-3-methylbut-2-enyl-diphosphate synthase [Eubacteriales bacterium]
MQNRHPTRQVRLGRLLLGGGAPIAIQSMTNTDTHDKEATLHQVRALEAAGCEIVRIAIPDLAAADIFAFLKREGVGVPLVADIHFDYRIALAAVRGGADKIRINPGNIGERGRVAEVVAACRERQIPIRIGVNSGSLEKHILEKYGGPTAEALAESALSHAAILEALDYEQVVLSVKSSDVPRMIASNRMLAERTDYPLHIGVTEAGGLQAGTVKAAVGIGTLLAEGIGDTVRVSLTADPLHEVAAAKAILGALHLIKSGMDIIACPTCGRTKVDLVPLLARFEAAVAEEGLGHLPLRVAIMGCAVNGPGEARDADIGIACGSGEALLFRAGEVLGKYPAEQIVPVLIAHIKEMGAL